MVAKVGTISAETISNYSVIELFENPPISVSFLEAFVLYLDTNPIRQGFVYRRVH